MILFYLFIIGIFAGSFGALLGLGGGFIIIPTLTILFGLPIHTAIGISLVGVIATSTGAAIVYVRDSKADIRLGMLLELGTTVGAVLGAVIAGFISPRALYFLFAFMMGYNAYSMYKKKQESSQEEKSTIEELPYKVKNVPAGISISGLAGIMSGLLGIGGGIIKIPAMYIIMGVPLKVATATSNFMVGVTAAASAFVYYFNGNIDPVYASPIALGVFVGVVAGTKANARISANTLKKIFVVIFVYIAIQMIIKGFWG